MLNKVKLWYLKWNLIFKILKLNYNKKTRRQYINEILVWTIALIILSSIAWVLNAKIRVSLTTYDKNIIKIQKFLKGEK